MLVECLRCGRRFHLTISNPRLGAIHLAAYLWLTDTYPLLGFSNVNGLDVMEEVRVQMSFPSLRSVGTIGMSEYHGRDGHFATS